MLSAGALMGSVAMADQTLDAVLKAGQAKTTLAQDSQKRIDRLAQETDDLTQEFKQQNKLIDDLRVFNAQMEKQVAKQLVVIQELDQSVEKVTVIERQIQPLVFRMLDSLEQFVNLDKPFQVEERKSVLPCCALTRIVQISLFLKNSVKCLRLTKLNLLMAAQLKPTKAPCQLMVKIAK